MCNIWFYYEQKKRNGGRRVWFNQYKTSPDADLLASYENGFSSEPILTSSWPVPKSLSNASSSSSICLRSCS